VKHLFVGCFSSKFALPYLKKSSNPHILNISPPLNMNPRWFKDHVGKLSRIGDVVDRYTIVLDNHISMRSQNVYAKMYCGCDFQNVWFDNVFQ
jgi:hypothetical protein